MRTIRPYGEWPSPVSTDLITAGSIGLGNAVLTGEDIYWTEARSSEGGRVVLVRRDRNGQISDVTPAPFNVRSRVHEYGGGALLVDDGLIFFVNFTDQRIYRQDVGNAPEALTEAGPRRYAGMILDRPRGRLICVCEDHTGAGEPENLLAAVALTDGAITVLHRGRDFYASPAMSPDGTRLAWLAWDHPDMPWDAAELLLARLDDNGIPVDTRRAAGGKEESIIQPAWSPRGLLHFVSDRTGWWNLYRWDEARAVPLYPLPAEFGEPLWVFGQSTYAFGLAGNILCAYTRNGSYRMAEISGDGRLEDIELPYTTIGGLQSDGRRVVFNGASPTRPEALVCMDIGSREHAEIRRTVETDLDPGYLSRPEAITYPVDGEAVAHSWYYPPANRDYDGPGLERPPLIVRGHGGPTAASHAVYNLAILYWTSRGFAVLDVNYRGSTGFGRAYRNALRGQWGVADVLDCVRGAEYLVAAGKVDGNRLLIRGGSAGGYTALAALCFHDTFTAGASLYGIGDLMALARDTHKFESRYLDRLIGPLPEAENLYRQRSPMHHVEHLHSPVIFFQGIDDRVVPPEQTRTMAQALLDKGIPVAALYFEGEGHGFRRAENIKRAIEAELYFYARILGFQQADPIDPVPISNLDG